MSDGLVIVAHETAAGDWKSVLYSERYACARCNISFEELTPRLFSFNSPYGACPQCHGLGTYQEFDEELVVPDPDKSLSQGALAPWKEGPRRYRQFFAEAIARFVRDFGVDPERPLSDLPPRVRAGRCCTAARRGGAASRPTRPTAGKACCRACGACRNRRRA